jgi:subtilisin family serine protease
MATPLERQIRRLVEGSDGTRSVIIHMQDPSEDTQKLLLTAGEALQRRSLSLTARDCLPADREPANTATVATPRPALRIDADSVRGSLSTSAADIQPRPTGDLIDTAKHRLEPLLENSRVQQTLETEHEAPEEVAEKLWASTSLVLDLSVADLKALAEEVPGIAGIYPNRMMRVPPVAEALNLPAKVLESRAASYGVRMIGALSAWGAHGARGGGVRVAILDTGVDASHPDLADKVVEWAEFDASGAKVPGSQPHDDNGHGTHCAGTVAGGNTSGQWIGVAPDAELCCAKVLGPNGGTDAQILAAMAWAIEQEVDVISMSLGGLQLEAEMPPTYTKAIVSSLRQGIPVVIAIGNEGSQTTGSPGSDIFALAVGATDHLDRPAGFSGGRTQIVFESEFINPQFLPLPYSKPDVSAPGVAVVSSMPGGTWKALNGTSMATPHVAGAIAVLLSATKIKQTVEPAKRGFTIGDLLMGSVEELGESGQDHRYGFGRIDVLRAIDFARERGF